MARKSLSLVDIKNGNIMSIVDELEKLKSLKDSGALTESEFDKAKSKVLNADSSKKTTEKNRFNHSKPYRTNSFRDTTEHNNSIGKAANRYVTFQIVMAVVGVILFLFMASKMFSSRPQMSPSFNPHNLNSPFGSP